MFSDTQIIKWLSENLNPSSACQLCTLTLLPGYRTRIVCISLFSTGEGGLYSFGGDPNSLQDG